MPTLLFSEAAAYAVVPSPSGSVAMYGAGYSVAAASASSSVAFTPLGDEYTPASSDPWRPKLRPGDFFLGTERYHLYAAKRTKTLGETTFSVFQLAGVPSGSLSCTLFGLDYPHYFVQGTELHLKWVAPEDFGEFVAAAFPDPLQAAWIRKGFLGKPSNPIVFGYDHYTWNDATQTFSLASASESFTLRDDEDRRYHRIEDALSVERERTGRAGYLWYGPRHGPVVLTDDEVELADGRGVVPEFAVDPVTGEITFATENLFWNPSFEILHPATGLPAEWSLGDLADPVPSASSSAFPDEALHGERFLVLESGAAVYQTVRLREPGPHTVSFYARLPEASASASVALTVNPIDVAGDYIDAAGAALGSAPFDPAVEVLAASVPIVGTTWARYTAVFGGTHPFFEVDDGPIPMEAFRLEVRFAATGGPIHLDAVQVEAGYEAFPFLGLAAGATLEYEGAPDANYVPEPSTSLAHPFRRDDVDFNASQSEMANGFLVLLDDGLATDFQLGRGGNGIWREGAGPQNVLGRKSLPYAKVSGIAKLERRASFHLAGTPVEEEIAPDRAALAAASATPVVPEAAYIEEVGSPVERRLHVETAAGVSLPLAVLFKDQFGNPLLGASCTIAHVGSEGTWTTTRTTDRSGRAAYRHTRQAGSSGVDAETVSFTVGTVVFTFRIDVV